MKQRETIFCENFIDKINPPRHMCKRDMNIISQSTGIDFLKKREGSAPPSKVRASSPYIRNMVTTDQNNIKNSPQRKAKGTCYQYFNRESNKVNEHGFKESKKHFERYDNMKSTHVTKPDLSILKYYQPERLERVNKYMNSNQMKNLFNQADNKYYKGLLHS